MAISRITLILAILPIWALANFASAAHHNAPAPAVDCSSVILNLADCLSFVTPGSTVKKPEGSCCSGLKTVLETNAECLCEGFKNSAQLGASLNITKAATLPSVCHLSASSVRNCGLSFVTDGAPALAPMALSPGSFAGAPVGSAANDVTPAPAPQSAGSSALATSIAYLMLTSLLAYISFF